MIEKNQRLTRVYKCPPGKPLQGNTIWSCGEFCHDILDKLVMIVVIMETIDERDYYGVHSPLPSIIDSIRDNLKYGIHGDPEEVNFETAWQYLASLAHGLLMISTKIKNNKFSEVYQYMRYNHELILRELDSATELLFRMAADVRKFETIQSDVEYEYKESKND